MCGGCCSDVWEIKVDEKSVHRVTKFHLTKISKDFENFNPFYMRETIEKEKQYYLQHIKNKCCFLNDNNLCNIQICFDYDTKPTICKTFPIRLVQLGEAYYVGVSFACPSVLKQEGEPLESRADDIAKIKDLVSDEIINKSELALSEIVPITAEMYLKIEEMLKSILSLDSQPFSMRLIAAAVSLDMLDMFIQTAATQARTPINECINIFIQNNASTNYKRILKIAQKNISSDLIKRMVLGMILSFRSTLTKRRNFYKTYFLLLFKHFVHFFPFGRIRLSPNDRTIRYSKIAKIKMPENDPKINALLQHYFTHLFIRKDLLCHKDVKSGFKIFIIFYALIQWYAQGLCVLKGSKEVTSEEVAEAISYVEKYFVFHSDFFQLMRTFPIIKDTIENLLKKKNLPYILAR